MALRNLSSSTLALLCAEVIVMLMFAQFTEYSSAMAITSKSNSQPTNLSFYPYFQDIHVMIFIGFGFLMVFLKSHSWTSVSYNLLIAAFSVQIAILMNGFWDNFMNDNWGPIPIDIISLIIGDFGAAAVLITFGALLGKVNAIQMFVIAVIELFLWGFTLNVGVYKFQGADMGGSVYIHTFGAYFGVACSSMLTKNNQVGRYGQFEEGNYNSQLIAMVGTVFLFCYWPSFNCVLAGGNAQMRVVVNTVMALVGSVAGAFATSALFHEGKFDMEDVLNATLAGGVIIGASCDMIQYVWLAMLIGTIGGVVSSYGYNKICTGIHDTCGVHNLHGIPGVLGGLCAVIGAYSLKPEAIDTIFPARGPNGHMRTGTTQALYQLAALGLVLFVSILSGLFTGKLLNGVGSPLRLFHDGPHFTDCEYVTCVQKTKPQKQKVFIQQKQD